MTTLTPSLASFYTLLATTTTRATRIQRAIAPALANPFTPLTFLGPSVTRKHLVEAAAMMNEAQKLCREMNDLLRTAPNAFHGPLALVAVDRLEKLGKDFEKVKERFGVKGDAEGQ